MKFSHEFIEQVRQANDIVSVISDYAGLKRRGNKFWACCPFHNEKTASFTVTAEKGLYYCFGCHASGDVFKFLMAKENISFAEAVRRLAERAGLQVPEEERSAEDIKREEARKRLYKINEMACAFFHNCLVKTRYGEEGKAYLRKRGLSEQTIRDFRLGFAPDSWNKLTDAFAAKGVAGKELVELGLAKEKNGRFYDAFRNRVIFPIYDGRDRVVGFGGRVLDDSKPKYLNSPETPIFNKRNLLFALNRAHRSIYDEGRAVLVEGYMDVVSAHNKGITNVVASLGTAFTERQARLLQRQAKELILAYDMDTAGRQATLRAMEIVRSLGLHIRVLVLADGKDPDEYINAHGPDAFKEALQAAPGVLEYMLLTALKEYDADTLEGKSSITASVMPALVQTDSAVVADAFMAKLAERLQIDENAVRSEYNAYVRRHPEAGRQPVVISTNVVKQTESARRGSTTAVAEENILRSLLEHPESYGRIEDKMEASYFVDPVRRSIFEEIHRQYTQTGGYSVSSVREGLSTEGEAETARILMSDEVPMDEQVLLDYVLRFKLQALQNDYKEHSARAAEYSIRNDLRLKDELAACKRLGEEIKILIASSGKGAHHFGS